MSSYSSDAEIEATARAFMDRTLPKSAWTHAAHFAVALWLLEHRGTHAMRELPGLIRAYNEATGVANSDTGGYHETITLASLRAARRWLTEHPSTAIHVVLAKMLATPLGRSDWLFQYWSREVLSSLAARRAWLEPDREPLPF
jgi:hypothetical protein